MRIFIFSLISLIIIWLLSFFYFLNITDNVINNRNITDAIIVINPKKSNLNISLQLLKAGYAPFIYIISEDNADDYSNYLKSQKIAPEQLIFSSQIQDDSEHQAISILKFLNKYSFKSIRLVADDIEIPRLMLELKHNLPIDIIIITHSINSNKKFGAAFKEYIKYTYTLITSF